MSYLDYQQEVTLIYVHLNLKKAQSTLLGCLRLVKQQLKIIQAISGHILIINQMNKVQTQKNILGKK